AASPAASRPRRARPPPTRSGAGAPAPRSGSPARRFLARAPPLPPRWWDRRCTSPAAWAPTATPTRTTTWCGISGAAARGPPPGPLPAARNHGGGAATGGRMYAIAGRHQWNETSGDVTDVDELDPATGAWTERAPIPVARSEIGASTLAMSDGRILVVGGSVA